MESVRKLVLPLKNIAYPWLFAPLFIFYLGYIAAKSHPEVSGDEPRYLRYAENLTQGFFARTDDLEFISGPGYPLLLAPFVALGLPLKAMQLFNAFLMIGAVWFFFRALSLYIPQRTAFWVSFLMGLYPFTLQYIIYAYSEAFSLFLSCAFIYYYCKSTQEEAMFSLNTAWGIIALGFLILTKVIYGYVVLGFLFAGAGIGVLFNQKAGKNAAIIGLGAFLLCVPYLMYTHSLTGKMMYWSTSGGQQLYFHASPFENEWGNWYADRYVWHPEEEPIGEIYDFSQFSQNHLPFYQTLPYRTSDSATVTFERDLLFKAKAKEYMAEHPEAFIKNTIASLVRLFFNFPRSYTRQHLGTAKYVFVNMFLLVFMLISIVPAVVAWQRIPVEIWGLMLMLALFIAGLSLLNGWPRHLVPVIPIFLMFFAFIFTHILSVRIKPNNGY